MKKFIIGVSGGPDSMALLDKYKNNIVAVCHVNYHDREDTNNDELLVKKYLSNYKNINLHIFDTSKDNIEKYKNIKNPQTYYRKIRYDFYKDIANKYNVKTCLIGHNKDDFIETAKMQLDLKKDLLYFGILKKSSYKDLIIYRPLINKWKIDLQKYCEKKGILLAVDYTNFSNIYKRNIIRKELKDWSQKQKNNFYIKIKFLNLINKVKYPFLNFLFKKWEKKSFDVSFIRKQSKKYSYRLWYLYFIKLNIRITQNKLLEINNFVLNYKGSNKKYRISSSAYLYIKNKKVIVEGLYE